MKTYRLYQISLIVFVLGFICLVLNIQANELDTSFGIDGRISTSVGNYGDQAYSVALQQDGKILVGGSSSNGADLDFAIVRYNDDGTLDQSFNYDGTATTQVGSDDDEIAAIAVQDDGYIVAAGYSVNNDNRDFALVRYAPDGERDAGFGLDGIVITEYTAQDDEITAMAVDDEGRIVVAGYSTGTAGRVVIVGRYLSNGELDPTFGSEGVNLTGVGDDALARSIDFDAEGRILIAGSYYNVGQTEVMVLRFTDGGELDSAFGEEGLALPAYTSSPTEGFGVKVHESGAIMVAGSVGSPGELDAALFNFTEDGRPDTRFGDNGMLVIEASQEDDMALALDIREDTIYLSGFTTEDGVRKFLFITLQMSHNSQSAEESPEVESVPFALKTGNTTTNVQIGERQVEDSYDAYMAQAADEGIEPLQATVSTAPFGFSTDDTSYAVAAQPDGKALAAGVSEENGVLSFAVARFESVVDDITAAAAPMVETGVPTGWLITKTPFEVTRTGAFSGGVITDPGVSIAKRGVVFSIAPDPVLKSGEDPPVTPENPDIPGGGTSLLISNEKPTGTFSTSGTLETTLSVDTNISATCKYSENVNDDFVSMSSFSTTGSTTHTQTLSVIDGTSYTYYVECLDGSDSTNNDVTTIDFTIDESSTVLGFNNLARQHGAVSAVSNFFVGTAYAIDSVVTDPPVDSTDPPADSGSGSIFDTSNNYIEEGFTEEGAGSGSYSSIIKNLYPATFYYIRAYAVDSEGKVYYGNQLGFKTSDSCFIATAAFGSIFHSSVKILRDFRDQYLVTNGPGRIFVNLYYTYSPPIADVIAGSPLLRFIVRMLLLPWVAMSWVLLHVGPGVLAAFMVVFSCLLYQRSRRMHNLT